MYEPDFISVGIVLAPCRTVQAGLNQQFAKVFKTTTIHSSFEVIDWEKFFEEDGRLYDMSRFQIALLSPHETLTVYVCNLADGWVSLYGNLVKAGAFDAYLFRATLSEQSQYKVFEMQRWGHGTLERHVRALQDEDGWSFLDEGETLPFESPMQYKNRQVGARLTRQLLEKYSEAAGYPISSVTRYSDRCWRFWRSG